MSVDFRLTDSEFRQRYPSLHAAWEWEGCPRRRGWDECRVLRFEQLYDRGVFLTFEDFLNLSCPEVA